MKHVPELDGLRGLAVVAVLLYHGGLADGGFRGVSIFFTLSGYLITSLFLHEHERTGAIDLRKFWVKRIKRLMPAALVCLSIGCIYIVAFGDRSQYRDIVAGLGYVANWNFIAAGKGYGDSFGVPTPVQHFWSLAIEEQFYILFPFVAWLGLKRGPKMLGAIVAAGMMASVASMVLNDGTDRLYYGTDTRSFEILAGALLAVLTFGKAAKNSTWALLPWAATVALWWGPGLHGSGKFWTVPQTLLTVAVIFGIKGVKPLAWRPLREIGAISYGLYLYHWPVFIVFDAQRTGLDGVALFCVRIGLTLCLTLPSYYLVEQPVRHLTRRPKSTKIAPCLSMKSSSNRSPLASSTRVSAWTGATYSPDVQTSGS